MNLSDYKPTTAPIDGTPRPKASQQVAATKRRRTNDEGRRTEDDAPPRPAARLPIAVGAIAVIVLLLLATSYQLAHAPAQPLQLAEPTTIPARTLAAPPTTLPTPTSAPLPTIRPTDPPMPTVAPQTGQGLTLERPAVPTDPPAPPPATPEPPPPPDVQLVVTGDNDQHTTVVGTDACKVARGARRCGK